MNFTKIFGHIMGLVAMTFIVLVASPMLMNSGWLGIVIAVFLNAAVAAIVALLFLRAIEVISQLLKK